MRLTAAASSALRPALAGPAQRATWLGVTPSALYLAIAGEPGVLAVLAHDAVRLPCGLVLASTSAELPLTALAPGHEPCLVGGGIVRWTGPAGPVQVSVAREWAPRRAAPGHVDATAQAKVAAAVRRVSRLSAPKLSRITEWAPDSHSELLAELPDGADHAAAVAGLLGRGPGLTPSGDDLVAGFLVGAHAFGLDVPDLRRAMLERAAARTTALSAALLWHAARGECIGQVADLAAVLTGCGAAGPAAARLLAVGHTSGAALAQGLLLAADRALAHRAAA
jgi:hypothetical protein